MYETTLDSTVEAPVTESSEGRTSAKRTVVAERREANAVMSLTRCLFASALHLAALAICLGVAWRL